LGREDFLTGTANKKAKKLITSWPDWPSNIVVLIGPQGSGKSHLAAIWSQMSNAPIIHSRCITCYNPTGIACDKPLVIEIDEDHVSEIAQEFLFFIVNTINIHGNYAVVTSRLPISSYKLVIPDLASRLRAALPLTLDEPDDTLLEAILLKLFRDRGISISNETIVYITRRIERSYSAAISLVHKLDCESLITKSPITRAMVHFIMDRNSTTEQTRLYGT